jgi:SAM-dependent methyltransferase
MDRASRYLLRAPMSLTLYRVLECEILASRTLERPLLDIGCGDGIFASVLFDEPVELGIDPNPEEIAKARTTGSYRELIVCPGDRVPKPDASFRTVFSNSTLEHIPDPEPVLREAHRLLAAGGRLLVTVPTDRLQRFSAGSRLLRTSGLQRTAAAYEARYNCWWRHYNAFDQAGWEALFERCGFAIAARREYGSAASVLAFDLMLPWALPALLMHRTTGRWILSHTVRRWYLGPLRAVLRRLVARDAVAGAGAMAFYDLRRPPA